MNLSVLFFNKFLASLIITSIAILSLASYADDSMKTPLVVGVNPFYKPLVFKKGDQLTGIDPEMALAVGKLLSRDIHFKELSFNELIPALQHGDIDVIMSGLSITDEREQKMDFTKNYLEIGQMAIISITNIGKLSYPGAISDPDRVIAIEPGTTGEAYAKKVLTAAKLKYFDTPDLAFKALRNGSVDFFIHDAPTSWKIAQSSDFSDLIPLYRPLTNEYLAWAVKKGNRSLLADLNTALVTLTEDGTVNRIQNRFIPVKIEVPN
jgi:polar amino acid transport system substrate-binding protein